MLKCGYSKIVKLRSDVFDILDIRGIILDKNPTIKKYLTVQKEGNRVVSRNIEHYNLDMIISLGYRVNSKKATKFRQWQHLF